MKHLHTLALSFLLVLFYATTAKAQLFEISLDDKVANSTLVVEGKVTGKTSFWNVPHTMILTRNTVQIYKIFKGRLLKTTIEIVTQGGSVGDDYIEASDLLSLDSGNTGVFFCYPNTLGWKSPGSAETLFDVYSSSQGFLKYDLSSDKVYAPFVEYSNIEGAFYNLLKQKTGVSVQVIDASFKPASFKKKARSARNTATATITAFSPATVNSGALSDLANNTLTITGSGFGVPVAGRQLIFKDANTNNAAPDYVLESISPYVTSWNDAQIVVRVPTRAATGRFGIVIEVGDTAFAPTNLNVFYAISNTIFGSGTLAEPRLMNANTLGGYSIVYSTETAGSGTDITTDSAYNNFRQALRTWKQMSGVNFIENGNTTNQVVSAVDNINTIMFDNTNTTVARIPSGTLAITYSVYSRCGGAVYGQKLGFDIVIRKPGVSVAPDALPFNKNNCVVLNTYDLETVLLHELGHALNLGHINDAQEASSTSYTNRNPNKVMHYSIGISVPRKSLDQSAYAGSLYAIIPPAVPSSGTCTFPGEMIQTATLVTPLNECPATFPTLPTSIGTSVVVDLDLATSNKLKDPQFTAIATVGNANGPGVAVTNNAYYVVRTNAGGALSFSLGNYSAFPAEVTANCVEQGVRMAIYQVNSCPVGQGFPAPGYATTFNGNTARTVNGFLPNTNYLLYFDGLYNAKASFTLTLTGPALPVILSDFYGEGNKTFNNLFVDLKSVTGDMKMIIERSGDGINYQPLGSITLTPSPLAHKYKYVDASPLNGKNYYRAKTISPDGGFEYTKVVLLQMNLAGQVLMYPNPVKDRLNVNLSFLPQAQYKVSISDPTGKLLFSQKLGAVNTVIPLTKHPAGNYVLQVTDAGNRVIEVRKFVVGR